MSACLASFLANTSKKYVSDFLSYCQNIYGECVVSAHWLRHLIHAHKILLASTVRFILMASTSSAVGKNDEASSLSKLLVLPLFEREESYAR